MLKEGHYHAGHLPTSPMSQVQGPGCQYPGGYGAEQFMADIEVNTAETCESSWSENALSPMSDHTLIGSPYSVSVVKFKLIKNYLLRH